MSYFEDVALNDNVYGLVYGPGEVIFVQDSKLRVEGFYTFQVKFKDTSVYYTAAGVPDWCSSDGDCQTVYYLGDINQPEPDFEASYDSVLSKKQIIKLQAKDKLEMRCPNGAWRNIKMCPPKVFMKALKNQDYRLFRKKK